MFETRAPTPKKSDLTRERLYEAAIALFAKQGFDQTSMRAIAQKAGVALGGTYYYFESKESFVYEYYLRLHAEHVKVLGEFLGREKKFARRLHEVVRSMIEVALPNKDMARALYRFAAHPESELSPFSAENKKLRLEALQIFEEVVEGSSDSFHPQIKKLLPAYLWLYQMGIILFWIYDSSPKSARTFTFIDRTVPLIEYFNRQIQSPLALPVRSKVLAILKSFLPDLGQSSETKEVS